MLIIGFNLGQVGLAFISGIAGDGWGRALIEPPDPPYSSGL